MKTTLYAKDSKQLIREWSIWSDGESIHIESGLLGGNLVHTSEDVHFGLAGRTREEQIQMRINSRVNKKKDSGYVESLEQARENVRTNSLGFLKPAKCSRFDQEMNRIPYTETFVQPKLDGHHCSIVNSNGELIAFSSNGKIIDSIDHILDGMIIPVGALVEGELYHHGTPLQTISSWVKRKQEGTKNLHFYCYDYAHPGCYSERYEILKHVIEYGDNASFLETLFFIGEFSVLDVVKEYTEQGYEGAILRLAGYSHEPGKRSKGLVKCKPMHFDGAFKIDDEFLVVNISPSKDGWAILHCETEIGVTFRVSAPGSMKEKEFVYSNRNEYIGKHVRIEFSAWTKDKKPFHPVAIEWREKFEE